MTAGEFGMLLLVLALLFAIAYGAEWLERWARHDPDRAARLFLDGQWRRL